MAKDYKKILALIVLVLAGVAAGLIISSRFNITTISNAVREPLRVSPELRSVNDSIADVATYVTPSVVNISTSKTVSMRNPMYPFFEDPFLRRFFGMQKEQPYRKFREQSLGSGVIVSSDGYIVTNNHVVEGAQEITVTLPSKDTYKGKVIGTDPRSDIAVVKIDASKLPAITWGDSDKLRPGDLVMAIGSPFGLSRTVTLGIASAVGRVNVGIEELENFIQTDAAINPGNSGGALVNIGGEIVGINTAIFSQSGGYMGIGFAIPSNMVRQVMESLIKTGKVVRGWLGIAVQDVTPETARKSGAPPYEGAIVDEVIKGGPADKAGLKKDDIIVDFNGKKVEDSGHLRNLAASSPVGARVTLGIIRDKKKTSVEVKMGELPKEEPAEKTSEPG